MKPPYSELLDAQMRAFISETEACYPPDTTTQAIAEQRKIYNAMARTFRSQRPDGLLVEDARIGSVNVRHYGQPVRGQVLFAHGGGFLVGDLESHDDLCADIAIRTGARVTAIDYRLCPEHEHPAALEDCLTVIDRLSGPQPVVLAGDSAGACLMAAAGATPGAAISGVVLIYPGLGGDHHKGSYVTHAHAPMLTREEVLYYQNMRGADLDDATAFPLKGNDYSNLPPVSCFSADLDPLRDDSAEYVQRINAAGGTARWINGPGLVHGWLRARHRSDRAYAMFAGICDEVQSFAQP